MFQTHLLNKTNLDIIINGNAGPKNTHTFVVFFCFFFFWGGEGGGRAITRPYYPRSVIDFKVCFQHVKK